MKNLVQFGTYQGMPVAVDPETNQIYVYNEEEEGMGTIFDDLFGVVKDHASNVDVAAPKVGSSGFWNTITDVFDSNTDVGQFVVPGLQTYVQNIASGGNFTPTFLPGFTPQQPQQVIIQDPNPGDNNAGLFSNPITIIVGLGTVAALTALLIQSRKKTSKT